jgi:two-component system, OmpR family, aerobic respiration control sensor histidine kinase ArcB
MKNTTKTSPTHIVNNHQISKNNSGFTEPFVVLLNSQFLIQEINEFALMEFFHLPKQEVINKLLNELLVAKNIDVNDLNAAIRYSEHSVSRCTKLYWSDAKKSYDVVVVCLKLKDEIYYAVTIRTCNNDSYNNLKAYINAIINNLPGAVYWKDTEGRYIGCNKFVAQMAGFNQPEEMMGKTDYDLCWKEFAPDWQALDQEVMQMGKTITREENAKLANGEVITELTYKTPLRDEYGEVVGIIGTSLDITDKKILEEQLTTAKENAEIANKAKTEFLYNIKHDIRTPFTGIFSLSSLLETEETDASKKECLHYITQSTQELIDYLNDILEYMEIEDSAIPILYKPFEIESLVDEIMTMMLPAVKYKSIEIQKKIYSGVPKKVIGDRYRVHRILLNLVGNAVKFTETGSVSIGIDINKLEGKNILLKMSIKDTGIGIPEDKYNVIFERFNRLTSSYSGVYKGAGLGLRAVKRLIDELNGQVLVESKLHEGSLFTCFIPCEVPLGE